MRGESMTHRHLAAARLAALTLLTAAVTLAVAQQPASPPATPAETPAASEAAPSGTDDAKAQAPAEAETPGSAPPKPATAKGSPQRFEPTEKVRPDFDVAFPIDI
jgi:hypothetical protein